MVSGPTPRNRDEGYVNETLSTSFIRIKRLSKERILSGCKKLKIAHRSITHRNKNILNFFKKEYFEKK